MTISVRDSLLLRNPDALVSAIPHLLGFHPRESIVVVWIAAQRVLLTQRLDLAGWFEDAARWRFSMWEHASARAAHEVIVVMATAGTVPPALVDALRDSTSERGVFLRDVLVVHDGRWRSALCTDASCCPAEGRLVDPGVQAEVAAEFAVLGSAPMPDRESVVRSMQPDEGAAGRIAALLAEQGTAIGATLLDEDAKDRAIGFIRSLWAAAASSHGRRDALSDDEALAMMRGLDDIKVRDTILWHLCHDGPESLPAAMDVFSHVAAVAPERFVPATATTCAIVAWLLGDGVRAMIAVERALQSRPDYNLAVLVAHALRSGLPPSTWRDAMDSVTRDECRHGLAASGATTA